MKKRFLTMICAAAAVSALVLTGCGQNADTDTNEIPIAQTETAPSNEAVEKVTPTFMYFVSASDADFDTENAVAAELEAEYEGKVNFTIINIDEDTEAANNFPVQGNTPAVIMLNTTNDISAMNFQCSDKAQLKEIIDAALE